MKNIALVDVDGHNFPNLALMKLSAYHKARGDSVEWYKPVPPVAMDDWFYSDYLFDYCPPDKIYASKVFSFKPDFTGYHPRDPKPVKGGTGYDITRKLPDEIEAMLPDLTLYPTETMRDKRSGMPQAFGFLTRGCIRSCPWCVVPAKEGKIREVGDVVELAQGRKLLVLLDNNFLAAQFDFIRNQLKKAARIGLRIDFNQGLDARLVTPEIARLLADCKWIRFIRFSCDTTAMIEPIRRAVRLIRETGSRREIFCYMLIRDIADAEIRLRALVELGVSPFAQPYRDFTNTDEPGIEQKKFAEFTNIKGGKMCLKKKFADYYH